MLIILPLFLVFLLIVMVPGIVAMIICRSIERRGTNGNEPAESGNYT